MASGNVLKGMILMGTFALAPLHGQRHGAREAV